MENNLKKKIYIYINESLCILELTQHCKLSIFQLKKKRMNVHMLHSCMRAAKKWGWGGLINKKALLGYLLIPFCLSLFLAHSLVILGLVAQLCPTFVTPWTVACQASLSMRIL